MEKREARRGRRTFTAEFKAEAVRLCKVGDRTISQVAMDLDLTETAVVREWVKRADVNAGKGPAGTLTTEERDELRELRKRVKRLEMKREMLEKGGGLLREGERVKFELVLAEKAHHPVGVLCESLGVSFSGFYAWKNEHRAPGRKRTRGSPSRSWRHTRGAGSATAACACIVHFASGAFVSVRRESRG